jgi:hypothetical protein
MCHRPLVQALKLHTGHIQLGNVRLTPFSGERLADKTIHRLGAIYTPPDFAQLLISWAVQRPEQKVLDLGVGEGIFAFAAYHRLIELGASATEAQVQLYGTEIDLPTYDRFLELSLALDVRFPGLRYADFFDTDFPSVDAVVGNPPYIRRTYIENVDSIRQSVLAKNQSVSEDDISRLTDLYVYFLLYGLAFLKPGGRLGVITADSWLNVGYGKGLKRYLLQYFEVESLITLDRRVFDDAEVKPVLILATRSEKTDPNKYIHFVRAKNNLPVRVLQQSWNNPDIELNDIVRFKVKSSTLKVNEPWSIHFKAPKMYEQLASHSLMTPMANLAETRIGLQTLAKDFFVLTPEQANLAQIEEEFLEPLAQSPRYFDEPVIEIGSQPPFYILYCSKSKEELHGTHVLDYILQAESREVSVRHKGTTVIGYQNKDRIKKSGRIPWYNLRTALERRRRASILIPRLVYRTFTVVWNKARFVPGELFIEFLPLPLSKASPRVYLAILTSSVTEIMLRAHAQVYGGGTYNINPGQIKKVPILNAELLKADQEEKLKQAYTQYLLDTSHDRSVIDDAIGKILGFDVRKQRQLAEILEDLRQIATDSKKSHSDDP